MRNERFEWNDTKARTNLRDHKIDFEVAVEVFDDLGLVSELDDRESYGDEDRLIAIGLVGDGRLLSVVYVESGERIRIISARKATRREQDLYNDQ